MCENAYSGCPHCSASTESIRAEATAYIAVSYELDDDGDVAWHTRECGDIDDDNCALTLYCINCGESEFDVEHDIVPDGCDCEECEPSALPATDDYHAEWLVIERIDFDGRVPDDLWDDAPIEVRTLYTRRTLARLPVRVDRATTVMEWVEANLPSDTIFMRLTEPEPAHRDLAIPDPTENQLELEVTT